MSRLSEFRALEEKLREQLQALEDMKQDKALQEEMQFETELRALMEKHNQSPQAVIALLDSNHRSVPEPKQPVSRKPRSTKRYKNPHTGEIVETKGGNHKVLKQWKNEYGAETVESWVL
ncbi:histone-like nucleoid-structuring protein, MvaT/MvaU family [Azomonas macrocytogenes]|uniref:1,6-anhydro-N-acetylmuramate kinase n=1 Tax=Azomonas macrocytogenes TaxID=69962 RepID=A0A839T8S5_AZOMA|nr:histone-like nucleoid-structuring protein, MvaT/MvaU family [Azomonas macrocytogenes]MBB3105270.1 1,6-anhydro-N-acetylmuramate kinase [Azomonas macrocytogenes]